MRRPLAETGRSTNGYRSPVTGELVPLCEPEDEPEPLELPPVTGAPGVVLTGCIAGIGAPLCSIDTCLAGMFGTGEPDARKFDPSLGFPAIFYLV